MGLGPTMPHLSDPGVPRSEGSAGRVAAAVAAAFGVLPAQMRAHTRGPAPVALARQSAMYLSHVALGLSLSAVGRSFGRDRATARHACRLIAHRRTRPGIGLRLAALEHALGRMRRHGAERVP
jgi:DnaA-like protein